MKLSVSNRLRSYRIRRSLTQEELAQRCLTSQNTILAIETGAYSASVSLALTLAIVLDCTVEDLFCIDDDRVQFRWSHFFVIGDSEPDPDLVLEDGELPFA